MGPLGYSLSPRLGRVLSPVSHRSQAPWRRPRCRLWALPGRPWDRCPPTACLGVGPGSSHSARSPLTLANLPGVKCPGCRGLGTAVPHPEHPHQSGSVRGSAHVLSRCACAGCSLTGAWRRRGDGSRAPSVLGQRPERRARRALVDRGVRLERHPDGGQWSAEGSAESARGDGTWVTESARGCPWGYLTILQKLL